jgi:transposase InsO family protein
VPCGVGAWGGLQATPSFTTSNNLGKFQTPLLGIFHAALTQCVHRHRFETLQHASRVIGDWIGYYNHRCPHQALNMRTPAETFALAA